MLQLCQCDPFLFFSATSSTNAEPDSHRAGKRQRVSLSDYKEQSSIAIHRELHDTEIDVPICDAMWDIPSLELQLGMHVAGFGAYVQSRVLEVLSDAIHSPSESLAVDLLEDDSLMRGDSLIDSQRRQSGSSVQLPSLKHLVVEYLDSIGWSTFNSHGDPMVLPIPSVDGENEREMNLCKWMCVFLTPCSLDMHDHACLVSFVSYMPCMF